MMMISLSFTKYTMRPIICRLEQRGKISLISGSKNVILSYEMCKTLAGKNWKYLVTVFFSASEAAYNKSGHNRPLRGLDLQTAARFSGLCRKRYVAEPELVAPFSNDREIK
jgi:hypothetical protein